MLPNYFKVAVRNLFRHKSYFFVNVCGLAIGMAACLLIIAYVFNEWSFEDCHEREDRIYRVQGLYQSGGSTLPMACAVAPLAPALREEVPEIETVACFRHEDGIRVKVGREEFNDHSMLIAGPELFDVFTLPLARGNPQTALAEPFSVIISDEMARKHYGTANPLGEFITLADAFECQITGVLEKIPANTQIHGDMIVSYASVDKIGWDVTAWNVLGQYYVYVLLRDGAQPAAVNDKIADIIARHADPETAQAMTLSLVPLDWIYLHSNMSWELQPSGNLDQLYLFVVIAALLLVIAGINFINLTTARTVHRMKEVGIRKSLGAHRRQLVRQFLGESVLLTVIAMAFGVVLFEIFKPQLESFLGRELAVSIYGHPYLVLSVLGIIAVVGIVSGSYPALYLSRFDPTAILKPGGSRKTSKAVLRRALVLFQFIIAVGLIFVAAVMYKQLGFFMTKDLGYNPDNVVVLDLSDQRIRDKCELLRDEIRNTCPVESVAAMRTVPGIHTWSFGYYISAGDPDQKRTFIQILGVDPNYLSFFGLDLVQGRDFSPDRSSDAGNMVIVNEATVKQFGLDNPIGHRFTSDEDDFQVIGVVEDFHMLPLSYPIYQAMLRITPGEYQVVAIRVDKEEMAQTMAQIEDTWNRVLPDQEFRPRFLSDIQGQAYSHERALGHLFMIFTLLAIFIACLGIFGLSTFTAEQKTKEIGIRKALGASVPAVVRLLSKELIILVTIASAVAWPVAYYLVNRWLQNFPYRTDVDMWLFVFSGLIAMLIGLLTISIQVIKAARTNPVDTLRYE